MIGLTVTAEWFRAGFEELVGNARFQARLRPHTMIQHWADPAHEAWNEAPESPCGEHSATPDRVLFFAANWELTGKEQWRDALGALSRTLKLKYPTAREIVLLTMLRAKGNINCGDPKSVVSPFIDQAIEEAAAADPLLRVGPRLELPDCSAFTKGGPHFEESARPAVARLVAATLAR